MSKACSTPVVVGLRPPFPLWILGWRGLSRGEPPQTQVPRLGQSQAVRTHQTWAYVPRKSANHLIQILQHMRKLFARRREPEQATKQHHRSWIIRILQALNRQTRNNPNHRLKLLDPRGLNIIRRKSQALLALTELRSQQGECKAASYF